MAASPPTGGGGSLVLGVGERSRRGGFCGARVKHGPKKREPEDRTMAVERGCGGLGAGVEGGRDEEYHTHDPCTLDLSE